MSLGFDREENVISLNDTAQIFAYIYDKDDRPLTSDELIAVEFVIQKPDLTKETVAGEINDDGSGSTRYTTTDQVGQYIAVASFTNDDGDKRSVRADFEVIDPFETEAADVTPEGIVASAVWHKFEDCFDATDEGPWLRDMTLNYFNKDKMAEFLPEALFDINFQNPPTALTLRDFVSDQGISTTDLPLLAQGCFVAAIRQLMRAYTEQPNPVGAQIAWHDRRDYLDRWQRIYQIEQETYMRWLALWKRQFLGLGHSKVLVSSKAGRLTPAAMRSRVVGRGYW